MRHSVAAFAIVVVVVCLFVYLCGLFMAVLGL